MSRFSSIIENSLKTGVCLFNFTQLKSAAFILVAFVCFVCSIFCGSLEFHVALKIFENLLPICLPFLVLQQPQTFQEQHSMQGAYGQQTPVGAGYGQVPAGYGPGPQPTSVPYQGQQQQPGFSPAEANAFAQQQV